MLTFLKLNSILYFLNIKNYIYLKNIEVNNSKTDTPLNTNNVIFTEI